MNTNQVSWMRLREVLRYNKTTGLFTWRVSLSNRAQAGTHAGGEAHGYQIISIDGRKYQAHRLAIFYVTRVFPENVVDHKNAVRNDNRFKNLRLASPILNAQNRRHASKNNRLQLLGVTRCKSTGRFRVQILANRQKHHIGRYDTAEAAQAAYVSAKRMLHQGNTL